MSNSRAVIGLLGAVAWSLFPSPVAATSASPQATPRSQQPPDALMATVSSVRDAGTLLISWVLDHASSQSSSEAREAPAGTQPKQVQWSSCPAIDFHEAQKLVDSRWSDKF